jgi:hypothetical protein
MYNEKEKKNKREKLSDRYKSIFFIEKITKLVSPSLQMIEL